VTRLLALTLALVLAAPAAGALTLVGKPANDTIRVRVDEGNLTARALDEAPTIDGEPAPRERQPVNATLTDWRGFANTTTLDVNGTGRLLLADQASGLILTLDLEASDEPDSAEQKPRNDTASEPGSAANRTDGGDTSPREPDQPPTANATNTSAPASPTEPGAPAEEEQRRNESAQSVDADAAGDEDETMGIPDAVPALAPVTLLGLLAAGAYLAERTDDEETDEDPPRLDP
jgi:hypothetical protein